MPVFRQIRDFFCTIFGRYTPGAIFAHLSFTPAHKKRISHPRLADFPVCPAFGFKSRYSAPVPGVRSDLIVGTLLRVQSLGNFT
jgi:hypothetical protein